MIQRHTRPQEQCPEDGSFVHPAHYYLLYQYHHLKHSLLEKRDGAIRVQHSECRPLLVSDCQGGAGGLPQEGDVLPAGLAAPGGDIAQHRGDQGPQAEAVLILR